MYSQAPKHQIGVWALVFFFHWKFGRKWFPKFHVKKLPNNLRKCNTSELNQISLEVVPFV